MLAGIAPVSYYDNTARREDFGTQDSSELRLDLKDLMI